MNRVSILLIAFLGLSALTGCSGSDDKQESSSAVNVAEAKTTPIDGAWQTVSFRRNNQPATNNQYKLFSNGFFSLISWDSTGKFSYGGFGKYELDGSMYKETFLYHNNPNYTGAKDWQEYEMKGDTLIMRGFNKVIVGGKDVTVDFPKIEEKRVRIQ
ncbi:MAG: hypothetical protein ABR503_06665 [Chitinophagaceae bacterium]